MRVILTAAGPSTRWAGHLGVVKQLAPIGGEPIIHRAARLFAARGCEVLVVASDGFGEVPDARLVAPDHDPRMGSMGRYWSSRHHWSTGGRTAVLFGDVYWTEAAVDLIVGYDTREWRWWARLDRSRLTGKGRPEGFGCTFWPEHHDEHRAAIERTARLWQTGLIDRCLGFEHWRVMQGFDGPTVRHPHPFPDVGRVGVIDDMTDDIDRPGEYDQLVLSLARAAPSTPGVVSVVVPWRDEGCPHRQQAWEWVRARYQQEHPGWEIVVADDGRAPGQPFNRSAAVLHGITAARGTILVITDADVWAPRVADAVDLVRAGHPWVVHHDSYRRLTPAATEHALRTATIDGEQDLEEPAYQQRPGSLGVYQRRIAVDIPMDQRFDGWGGEENAWGWALETLAGLPVRLSGPAWHLWHPPQPRLSRHVGNSANSRLRRRYQLARGDRDAMRALIAGRTASRWGWHTGRWQDRTWHWCCHCNHDTPDLRRMVAHHLDQHGQLPGPFDLVVSTPDMIRHWSASFEQLPPQHQGRLFVTPAEHAEHAEGPATPVRKADLSRRLAAGPERIVLCDSHLLLQHIGGRPAVVTSDPAAWIERHADETDRPDPPRPDGRSIGADPRPDRTRTPVR